MLIGIVLAFCVTLSMGIIVFVLMPGFLNNTLILQTLNILFLSLFSFVSSLLFRITLSKTIAPELVFFTIFILIFLF